ncbi:MAG: hypothetical protein ABI614_14685, partial [Planctomycetota bacterium]
MIRQPISRKWRFALGVASILTLALLYTLLSSSRQTAAKREQQQVAENKLQELQLEQAQLAERRYQAAS